MRQVQPRQLQIGEVDIGSIELDHRSRDWEPGVTLMFWKPMFISPPTSTSKTADKKSSANMRFTKPVRVTWMPARHSFTRQKKRLRTRYSPRRVLWQKLPTSSSLSSTENVRWIRLNDGYWIMRRYRTMSIGTPMTAWCTVTARLRPKAFWKSWKFAFKSADLNFIRRHNSLFVSFTPAVSKANQKAMRRKIRKLRVGMRTELNIAQIAGWLNPMLSGWLAYLSQKSNLRG